MQVPSGPFCQSCGMSLSRDEMGGGTEVDGRRTTEYCSHCYQDCKFTRPSLTAQEMMELVEGRMRRMNVPEPAIARETRNIPSLKRWKKH